MAGAAQLIEYGPGQFDQMHDKTARVDGPDGKPSWRLSASVVPALFCPPPAFEPDEEADNRPKWMNSAFALGQIMLGKMPEPDIDEAALRGRILEGATTALLRKEGLDVVRLNHFAHWRQDPRFFASPDYVTTPSGMLIESKAPIKPWPSTGVPLYVYLQCQWQMLCCERNMALATATMITQYKCDIIIRPVRRDEATIRKMVAGARLFLDNLAKGILPRPDESSSSYDALRLTGQFADRVFQDSSDEAARRMRRWIRHAHLAKKAKAKADEAKTFFLAQANDHQADKIVTNGGKVWFNRIESTRNGKTSISVRATPQKLEDMEDAA